MFVCPVYVECTFCLNKYGVLLTSNLCLGAETSYTKRAKSSGGDNIATKNGEGGWMKSLSTLPFRVRQQLRTCR